MSFTQREARRLIRKAVGRVPEGEEIRHLNIMPMMDMMTILLVAFIYQAAVSATQLLAGTVSLPRSLTADELPEDATGCALPTDDPDLHKAKDPISPDKSLFDTTRASYDAKSMALFSDILFSSGFE